MAKNGAKAYWLQGDESCPYCHFQYAIAVERHCSICDGPACPHCVTVVRETGEIFCRDCQLANEGENEA